MASRNLRPSPRQPTSPARRVGSVQNAWVDEPPPRWSRRKVALVVMYTCVLPVVGIVLGGWWIAVAFAGAASGLFAIRSMP